MKYEMNKVGLFIFILCIAAGITDLGMVVFGGVNGSISSYVVSIIGPQAPVVVFVTGLVAGHLFFPMRQIFPKEDK